MVKCVAVLTLVLFAGSARFQYVLRFTLKGAHHRRLVTRCTWGIFRQRWQPSPAFDWAVPSSDLLPNQLLDFVEHLVRDVLPEAGRYLVPALARRCPLWAPRQASRRPLPLTGSGGAH